MRLIGPRSPTNRSLASLLKAEWAAPGSPLDGSPVVVYAPRRSVPDLTEAAGVFAAMPATARLVLLSSAAVCVPDPHHPGMVVEGAVPASRVRNPIAAAWRRLEALAAEHPAQRLIVLRPAALAEDPEDPLAGLLHQRLALTLPGHDPTVQFLSLDDLGRGIRAAVDAMERGIHGTFHLTPTGNIPLRQALRRAGTWRWPVPRWLQRIGRSGRRGRLAGQDAAALEYRRYSWTLDSRRSATLGFAPRDSSLAAVCKAKGRPTPTDPPRYDDFGMDRDYIAAFGRTLFPFLHDVLWRVEYRGMEHVPREGRAVLTGIHRGFMPWDGVMILHHLARTLGRYPRFLIHPGLIKYPFLANYMTKLGGIVACRANGARVLAGDHLLGIFPEGIQGAFRYYRDAYTLGRFGRGEYIKMALRHRAPIVPFVTVGSAEIFPILAKIRWRWFEKTTEWPCLPVTPTLGMFPLPAKWHTQFLEPLPVHEQHGPEAADDPRIVRAINREVRQRMQDTLDTLRARRPSIFFGSAFSEEVP
jgi:1-acyl-sn-glycerol-3-phosphate acyltransferase